MDLDALAEQHGDAPTEAYLLIFQGLSVTQRMHEGHVSGMDLVAGCLAFARETWGAMGSLVLRHWGIRTSMDLGRLVWRLADAGVISRQESDSLDDFQSEPANDPVRNYDRNYPWDTAILHVSSPSPSLLT